MNLISKLFSILQLKRMGAFGSGCKVYRGVVIHNPAQVRIGSKVAIGNYVVIWGGGGVRIGDNTLIAAHSVLVSQSHSTEATIYRESATEAPIVIGNNVWIGAGVVVLPGVEIGSDSVIGAGSVVTRDLPAGWICHGLPARPIRRVR